MQGRRDLKRVCCSTTAPCMCLQHKVQPHAQLSQTASVFLCCSDKAIFFRIVRRVIDCRRRSASTSAELPFIDALLSAQLSEAITESDAVSYLIGGFHTSGYCEGLAGLWYCVRVCVGGVGK